MYIYCKVSDPDRTFYNAFYEEYCGNIRRMHAYAYGGYCVVMTESAMHALFRGEQYALDRFNESVQRYETNV